jgi:hypothetical protein
MKTKNYLLLLLTACTLNGFAADAPKPAYMDYAELLTIRSGIQNGDNKFVPAYQKLLKDANALLDVTPQNITEGDTPPTGDKHDFFTIGKYSWPNPKTADGLPYIRIDCEVNKEAYGDRYDLNRYQDMIKRVNTLSLAWFYSQDEKYAAKATELLRVWYIHPETKMNPNFDCAAALPGSYNGAAIGIIFGGVMIKMLDHVKLLGLSTSWTEADDRALKAWFTAFNTWMLESEFGKKEAKATNNHGGWYAAQVAAYALYTGNMEQVNGMVEYTKKQIGQQIAEDGGLPAELRRPTAFGYSNYGLQALTVMASIAQYAGADLWHYKAENGRDLKLAWDFLAPYIAGEKTWEYDKKPKATKVETGALLYLRKASKAYKDSEYARITKIILDKLPAQTRTAWLEGTN